MVTNILGQRQTVLRLAILTALLTTSNAGMATTSCQADQIEAAGKLIYQSSSAGLLGCDSKEKKENTADPQCTTDVEKAFNNAMKNAKKQPGCTFNFESQAVLNRWKNEILAFRDSDCRDQKCKADGRKRRRASQIDLLYGMEARALLKQSCETGGRRVKVRSAFEKQVNTLLIATPGLLSPENGSKRMDKMEKAVASICGDIASRSATAITVEGEDTPGETAINLNAANNNPLVTTMINEDPSNMLKSARNVDVQWGRNSPKRSAQKITDTKYEVRIPAIDIVDDKQSCSNAGAACDNQQVDLSTRFLGNNSLIYKENRKIWVDVVPPQTPDFSAAIESVTMSRDNKIVAVVPENADDIQQQLLRIRGKVSNYRAASQTDNKFHNQGEASSVTVSLGDCTSNERADCIEKKGFKEQPTSDIAPKDVDNWATDQVFTTTFSAGELAKFATIEGRDVDVSSFLKDFAGNQGASASEKIKFIQQVPSVTSITPEGDQACASSPGVYNIKANSVPIGGIKVTLPNGIVASDILLMNYRNPGQGEVVVSGSPWKLTDKQQELRFSLADTLVLNQDEKPQSPNATLIGFIKNGNSQSTPLEKGFLADLTPPGKPTLEGDPITDSADKGRVRVKLTGEKNNWSVKSGSSVLCNSNDSTSYISIDSLTKECSYPIDLSEDIPTFTAEESDWACNSVKSDPFTPELILPPIITPSLSACSGVPGGVVVNSSSPVINVRSERYILGDILISRILNPRSFRYPDEQRESVNYPVTGIDVPSPLSSSGPNGLFESNIRRGQLTSKAAQSRFYIDTVRPGISVSYKYITEGDYIGYCEVTASPNPNTSDRLQLTGGDADCMSSASGSYKCYLTGDNFRTVTVQDWACNISEFNLVYGCETSGEE